MHQNEKKYSIFCLKMGHR